MRRYYKVVRTIEGKGLWSFCHTPLGGWTVKYKEEEWSEPVLGSMLFVFGDLQASKDFAWLDTQPAFDPSIWECEVRDPRRVKHCARLGFISLEKWWEGNVWRFSLDSHYGFRRPTPLETYGCTGVKLLRKVA